MFFDQDNLRMTIRVFLKEKDKWIELENNDKYWIKYDSSALKIESNSDPDDASSSDEKEF